MNPHATEPMFDAVNLRFQHYLSQVFPPQTARQRYTVLSVLIGVGVLLSSGALLLGLHGDLWAWAVLPFGLALVARCVYAFYRTRANAAYFARLRRIAERGMFVKAYLVQVNREMLTKGSEQIIPCRVLFTFDQTVAHDADYMRYLAQRVYRMIGKGIAATNDLSFLNSPAPATPPTMGGRRRQLPLTLTDGSLVYCADLWVKRAYQQTPFVAADSLPCIAEPEEDGGIEMVPSWIVPETTPTFPTDTPHNTNVWG